MAGDRPTPENKQQAASPRGQSGVTRTLVQAEKLMQIAFVLPCAMLVGWGMGYGVDKLLHTHWAVIPGLILGIIAGMVSVIRTAMAAMEPSSRGLASRRSSGQAGTESSKQDRP